MRSRTPGGGPASGCTVRRRTLLTAAAALAGGAALLDAVGRTTATEAADDTDEDVLQDALRAVPLGGAIVIDREWVRSRSLVVDRPVRIRFTEEGRIRMVTTATAVVVTASGVEIVGADIRGVGSESGGEGHGIAVMGDRLAPLRGVVVRGGRFRDLPHDGVHLEYCDHFRVTGTTMDRVGYAGVLGVGVVDGVIDRNRVSDVRQPRGRVNSYGIALTRDATATPDVTRRSARVRVVGNHVSGVPAWEGIDTHAGEGIEIRGNVVTACRVGIAAVPSKDPGDRTQTSVAPIDLVIADNVVTRGPGLSAGSGILVSGAGTTVGSTRPRATGRVTGNVVTGYGGGGEAGILVKLTRGMVLDGNRVRSSADNAICLVHSNAAAVARNNSVRGVSGTRVGVNIRAGANDGSIHDNDFAVTQPALAVAVRFGGPDNRFHVSGNDWGNARVRVARGGAAVTS
jgi:nitrous oxidase accessory protein NosD